MLELVWVAFKFLFSLLLAAAPVVLFLTVPKAVTDARAIGVSAMLVYFAALPWLRFDRLNRALALAGFCFALVFVVSAALIALGHSDFPQACRGRSLWCDLENVLYGAGGRMLAALPIALCAALLLAGSIRLLFRTRWR